MMAAEMLTETTDVKRRYFLHYTEMIPFVNLACSDSRLIKFGDHSSEEVTVRILLDTLL